MRYLTAAALALALAIAAPTASGRTNAADAPTAKSATTIRVWLMTDANGWMDVVNSANAAFKAAHPGSDVKVEIQTWGDHLTKFDAALAGNNAPDVIEFGNTEIAKYAAAGALADLTKYKSSLPNSKTWLKALTDAGTYRGKLYGVPYYAGARAVFYRKDQYKAAGIKTLPKSLSAFEADQKKLMKKYGKDSNFSGLYFPGQYWYAAMSFVYDYGGAIARFKNGKWVGSLDSSIAQKALTRLKTLVRASSRADRTGKEDTQDQVFAQGHVASMIGNGWEWGGIIDPKTGNPDLAPQLGAYPMPSHIPGKVMPTFLGGSNLAVPVTSSDKQLAVDWLKAFTSTSSMRSLASGAGVIANTTILASVNASKPQLAPFAAAAARSWFIPNSPNWVQVENAKVLQNMLVAIFTGRKSVAGATKSASKQITSILNGT
jgi:N,N'-diacetylchitobiose transport system substrate-binding protein